MNLFTEFKSSAKHTLKNHPAETILILLVGLAYAFLPYYALFMVLVDILPNYVGRFLRYASNSELYYNLPIFLVAIYSLRRFKAAYITAFFGSFVALFALLYIGLSDTHFLAITTISFILLLSDGFSRSNETFVKIALKKLSNLSMALATGAMILIVFVIILAGIQYLFNINLFINQAYFILFLSSVCWFFMVFEDANLNLESPFYEKIFNFLLTPALIIYTIILYIYIVKIAIFSGLPRGGVAYIVLVYLIFGFVFLMIFSVLSEKKWLKFYANFKFLALAPIVLLWVGIVERVSTYGFTPDRVYLCGVAGLVSVVYAMNFVKFLSSYRLISVLCMSLLCVTFFILDTRSITINSQTKRLEELVHKLNLNNLDALKSLNQTQLNELQEMSFIFDRYNAEFKPMPELLKHISDIKNPRDISFVLDQENFSDVTASRIIFNNQYYICKDEKECEIELSFGDKTAKVNLFNHAKNALEKYDINMQHYDDMKSEILFLRNEKYSVVFKAFYVDLIDNEISKIHAVTLMLLTSD